MRFEYTRVLVPVEQVIAEMNSMGADGWRVINVRHLDPEYTTPQHIALRSAFHTHTTPDLVAVLFERQETIPD